MANEKNSKPAREMRSGSQEQKSQATSKMGQAGGRARGTSQGVNQGGGRKKEMNISEAASILGRDSSSEEEKREAARILGREGGKSRGDK